MNQPALDFASIRQLHQSGSLDDAKKAYLLFLKKNPNHVEALHALSILYAQQDNYDDAVTYLQKAIQLQPNNPVLYLHFANMLKTQGLFSQASELLHKVLEIDPNCISAYNNLGTVYYAQEKLNDAIHFYRQALEKQPDFLDAQYNLGLTLLKNNEIDEGIAIYEHLLQHAPEHVAARFHLACALMQQEKITNAEKHFLIIEETHPYHVETQTNLATCYLKLGACTNAKKHYLNALELAPQDTQILYNLGIVDTQLGNMDSAIQYYQRAIAINPNYFEAHNNLGTLFIFKQHPGLALHHFQEALRLQPHNKSIGYTVDALSKNQLLLASPPDYITTLFDAYADHYDAHLLTALDYQVPKQLYDAVSHVTKLPTATWDILDLGCGTGLSGIPFQSAAKTLTGVDLSTKMLDIAAQKNIYHELIASDLVAFLQNKNSQYDLVLAGDVLVYIGDLDSIFSSTRHALRNNGLFAFNAEICIDSEFEMNQSGRFSHKKEYLDDIATKNHFNILFYQVAITRLQNNEPVEGHLYVLQSKKSTS